MEGVREAGQRGKIEPDRRRNPQLRSGEIEEQLYEARKLREEFSGEPSDRVLKIRRKAPHVALAIGELDFVGYTTSRDGRVEKYIHRFPKKTRPLLASSYDGSSLEILGGDFRFTEAGIEG